MTTSTFTIAGFSTLSGQRKVRFANGTVEARSKILERNGHVDIDLQVLPSAMTKAEAMQFLGVTDEDPRAPKGIQAAAAKAKKTITKVVEIKTEVAPAVTDTAEEVAA